MTSRGQRTEELMGQRLRERREVLGLSLADVAARADVTKGFLSQLERGLSHASVATLRRIADAVEVGVGELIDQPQRPMDATAAPRVHFGGQGAQDHLLTPVGLPGFQVLHADVEAGGHSDYGPVDAVESHFVYVLQGALTLTLNDQEHVIAAGQSMAFQTPSAYGWRNDSSDTVSLLWATSPPVL